MAETLAFLETSAVIDPAFAPFVRTAHARNVEVRVLSSGIRSIIDVALKRNGIQVPVFANDVDFATGGWTMSFIDESANGHDKAAHVRAAHAGDPDAVYVGDGMSDFAAAHEARRWFCQARPSARCVSGVIRYEVISLAEVTASDLSPSPSGRRSAFANK